MIRMTSTAMCIVALVFLAGGCERGRNDQSKNKTKGATTSSKDRAHDSQGHSADDGHDHSTDDQQAHSGDDHGAEAGHGHGKPQELGVREIGDFTVKVAQFGLATSGATELALEIRVQATESPSAVRVLVRNNEGAESLKVKAHKVGDQVYDAHVGELPPNLNAGGTVVVEIERPSGTESVEFGIRRG